MSDFLHLVKKKITINVLIINKINLSIILWKKGIKLRKYLGEKYNKFSLRKLTVGVCSLTIGSFFLMSTVQPEDYVVKAADNAIVHYKYVGEDNLTDKEKE